MNYQLLVAICFPKKYLVTPLSTVIDWLDQCQMEPELYLSELAKIVVCCSWLVMNGVFQRNFQGFHIILPTRGVPNPNFQMTARTFKNG